MIPSFSPADAGLPGTGSVIKGASFLPAPSQLVSSAASRASLPSALALCVRVVLCARPPSHPLSQLDR